MRIPFFTAIDERNSFTSSSFSFYLSVLSHGANPAFLS
ncbi:hypothetical protein HMPREF1115_1603 [Streptococcus oralis SK610]|uniref:Uncharacterized protein n=1 Tax=Streptococcus oralis SK610 TaxID=1095741 RepID=I0Q0N0_STROR|nr:hypothetical protein HMPREF1115_1603 [Streptococcus oralis SK610]